MGPFHIGSYTGGLLKKHRGTSAPPAVHLPKHPLFEEPGGDTKAALPPEADSNSLLCHDPPPDCDTTLGELVVRKLGHAIPC